MRHVKRIELRLRLPQGYLHLTRLQHLIGMIRRDTQRLSAVNDIFSESQGE